MKPGTLSALNHRLCVPPKPEPAYRFRRHGCPRLGGKIEVSERAPALVVADTFHRRVPARASGGRRGARRFWKRATLAAFIAAANLCVLAFERVDRVRERHQLGREIAVREQRAQRLAEISRHVAGVVRLQQAKLQGPAAPRIENLAQEGGRRPTPLSGG